MGVRLIHISLYFLAGFYPISVNASNNISSAYASSVIRILKPVSLEWKEKPPPEIDVGETFNFSFVVNGTNVTITVDFGDDSPADEDFYESAEKKVINISHA